MKRWKCEEEKDDEFGRERGASDGGDLSRGHCPTFVHVSGKERVYKVGYHTIPIHQCLAFVRGRTLLFCHL